MERTERNGIEGMNERTDEWMHACMHACMNARSSLSRNQSFPQKIRTYVRMMYVKILRLLIVLWANRTRFYNSTTKKIYVFCQQSWCTVLILRKQLRRVSAVLCAPHCRMKAAVCLLHCALSGGHDDVVPQIASSQVVCLQVFRQCSVQASQVAPGVCSSWTCCC